MNGEPDTEPKCESAPISAHKPRYGDELDLAIESFDERGLGLARMDDYRFRVRHGSVGSRVRVRVLRRRKNAVDAVVLARLEPGPHALEPRCAHFGSCGGCSFQDLAYAAQLEGLRRLVEKPLQAHGLLASGVVVEPVIAAPEAWKYRNKMEFTFGSRRWIAPTEPAGASASFALGLHAAGLYSKVVDVAQCSIQSDVANRILCDARDVARELGLEPWDVKAHRGLLRHLVVRVAARTGEVLVDLVTSEDAHAIVDEFARLLRARRPEITTFVQNVNTRSGQTALGERERVVHGAGHITEVIAGLRCAISANSFFQTNTLAAEKLFEIVRAEADLDAREVAWDLYCGTGVIALVLASVARTVVGFEIAPSAVLDAERNAAANGITNVRFVAGDVLTALDVARDLPPADVVVVDPPRAGLHPRVLPQLARMPARRIVYVSCNPEAAARDVAVLAVGGWRLARVRPLDLFPHTPHVETVLRLERAP